MDFIEPTGFSLFSSPLPYTIAAVILIVVGFITMDSASRQAAAGHDAPGLKAIAVVTLTAGLMALVLALASLSSSDSPKADRSEQVIEQISDTYGIDITEEQFDALEYPDEKPSGFETFGTIAVDGSGIRLVWSEGHMVLESVEAPEEPQVNEIPKKD